MCECMHAHIHTHIHTSINEEKKKTENMGQIETNMMVY